MDATIPSTATPASIAGRHIFYNRSFHDGTTSSVSDGPNYNNAIDDSKSALLSGTATFANYTGYSRGINGIMVDIANAADGASITEADFEFRVSGRELGSFYLLLPLLLSLSPGFLVAARGAVTVL